MLSNTFFTSEQCSRDSAIASYVDDQSTEIAIRSQYQAAYNYAEEAANINECALQCALACKKTCHTFVFEDNTCNFIRTDIPFKEPKPFILLTGNVFTSKVIKKVGKLSLINKPLPFLMMFIIVENAGEALKMLPDDIKGVKFDKELEKLTMKGMKDSETFFVFDNTDLKELKVIATPTMVMAAILSLYHLSDISSWFSDKWNS